MTILELILLVFATRRITRLVVKDRIMQPFRDIFLVEDGDSYVPKNVFGELIHCQWCVGFWSAVIIISVYEFAGVVGSWVIMILACAYLASLFTEMVEK